ncbi:thiamine-phosphate kinase [Perlucidibaca aquatica]|uniref:thiamine-phosphate kinase n=1 Tax=Perlucidibaca aquatica TaxID=1852776 RepID=UPI00083B7953|nr:thiamine-phosphate kinase [Perlucidibaca aquatica]
MALDEFGLIRRYFTRADRPLPASVRLGIGDDAALLDLPPGESLAVTTDTLVAGRHFPADALPFDIGWKALAVNLSDLAAMSATPVGVTLALTLPAADEAWLAAFAEGFFTLADAHGVPLIGGDTTRGPLSITVTALGSVPPAQALRRDGAQLGDLIYVSGTLGDGGLGLALTQDRLHDVHLPPSHQAHALARLHRPTPRLALGLALRGMATAAMDVSDGLLQDLGHLLKASGGMRALGATLNLEQLPLSPAMQYLAGEGEALQQQVLDWALAAGDDYELLFTVPASRQQQVEALAHALELPLTQIGVVSAAAGLNLTLKSESYKYDLKAGYRHF